MREKVRNRKTEQKLKKERARLKEIVRVWLE